MSRRRSWFAEWVGRNGLAVCCVIGPLLFALIAFNCALVWLTPDISAKVHIDYVPAGATQTVNKSEKPDRAPVIGEAAATKAESAKSDPGAEQIALVPAISLRALQYRGEARYAAASAFIYVASAMVLAFSLVIVYRRLTWKVWLSALIGFFVISYVIAFHPEKPFVRALRVERLLTVAEKPPGRELVVENLLNAAENFPAMKVNGVPPPRTGDRVSLLVSLNTIAALVPVGMLLVALAGLSVRDPHSIPDPADLRLRRTCLRIALGLASVLFVIGVLANKVLVAWPLSLIIESQSNALEPLAEAVTLELGAMGTIAIVAAFTPAITSWWLDVERYRRETADKAHQRHAQRHKAEKAAARTAAADADDSHDPLSEQGPLDEFVFAPLSTISGIIAALAPLLASPVVDAIRSLLSLAK